MKKKIGWIIIGIIIVVVISVIGLKIYKNVKLQKKVKELNIEYSPILKKYGLNDIEELRESELTNIRAFFLYDVDEAEQYKIINEISKMEDIESVGRITKEQGLEEMKERFKEDAELLEGVEADFFPDGMIIKLKDTGKVLEVSEKIEKIPGIKKVTANRNLCIIKSEIEKELSNI